MPSLRDLAWELRRYGFTQLRHTTHGILYGKGELRFSLVNEVNQKDAIGVSNQAD
jgi:hypothetical protein